MTRRRRTTFALAAWAMLAAPAWALELDVPVECELGRSCFIQQYTDHDPSPGASDHACGTAAYDGHTGTDFRLRTTADAEPGVAVVAAADGMVKGRRDGVPDLLASTPADLRRVQDRECGNGVVIAHEGGWETQYCHLKQGSVAVEVGEPVEAGRRIGAIGYSGAAAFPHLHLEVRHRGTSVDPFLGPGGDPQTCGADARSLWSEAALDRLEYRPGEILDIGFASDAVELPTLETGSVDMRPDRQSPAIVAWGWAINLQTEDEVIVELSGPNGNSLARNAARLDSNKAQYMLFAGRRQPHAGWPAGRYSAAFTVMRQGAPAIEGERHLDLD